ncbi:MAG: YciI family protein [Actinomycetota bacterium]|nr:YciI family protein [Actinomycetota bacterium]
MAQFMIVYKGDATDMAEMTEEEMQAVMMKWAAWMEGVGSALADVGAPFGPSSSIVDDGSPGTAVSLTGYSILEADSMDAARALADDHPFLSEGKGNYAIDLYEMMPVPTMDG